MCTSDYKVAILGAGAIGQLLFKQLTTAGCAPYFITRGESSSQQTLTFTSLAHQASSQSAQLIGSGTPSTTDDKLTQVMRNTQLVILCVKAYQVNEAINSILTRLPEHCHILLLHNGMGPHIQVQKQLSTQGLSVGTTSQGALKVATWHIQQTGSGSSQFGHVSGPKLSSNLKKLLNNAIPQSQWSDPILPLLWQKLAINASINPLTAIEGCRNGALAKIDYQPTIEKLISELVEVAKADGIELDKLALTNRVYEVIALTANNFSSMHQDVMNKRPTEVGSINGYIITRAQVHGLGCKVNEDLFNQITKIESQYHTSAPSNLDKPTDLAPID
ncbi:MAG: 2-dehydropantoate 2-reductase [Shewanella sp.]|jgi:2-dehydropantoate 2-reductase